MSQYTEKNLARRAYKGAAGSGDRNRWLKARAARRALRFGAFGLLNHHPKTQEDYDALAMYTRGQK